CELRRMQNDVCPPAQQPAGDRDQRNDRDRKRDSPPAVLALAGRGASAARGDAFDIRRTVVYLSGRDGRRLAVGSRYERWGVINWNGNIRQRHRRGFGGRTGAALGEAGPGGG